MGHSFKIPVQSSVVVGFTKNNSCLSEFDSQPIENSSVSEFQLNLEYITMYKHTSCN